MGTYTPQLACATCAAPAALLDWRCAACGGPVEIINLPAFDAGAIVTDDWSLWRYRAMLPVAQRFSLGEGGTPLVRTTLPEGTVYVKLEYLNPTGSFKDRGTVTLINHLLALGVGEVIDDSSGNAGAALAMYARATGIQAQVFVAAGATTGKKRQIALGAALVEVQGTRSAVRDACEVAAAQITYASHAWSPFFVAGQVTAAWEIWEQMGRRAPDAVVMPVAQGGLFLGMARGFRALCEAGLIERLPRLYVVQSAYCDPLVRAWEADLADPAPVVAGRSVAEGIMIDQPVRGREILAALRESGGAAFRVGDEAVLAARDELTARGLLVEPTSAAPAAALGAVREHLGLDAAEIVIPLTGSGLKGLHGG